MSVDTRLREKMAKSIDALKQDRDREQLEKRREFLKEGYALVRKDLDKKEKELSSMR